MTQHTLDPLGLLAGMAPRPFPDYLRWLIDRLWGGNAKLLRYWLTMGIDVDPSVLSKWARGDRRPHESNVLQIEQAVRHLYHTRALPPAWADLAVEQLWRSWRYTTATKTGTPDARILRELDRIGATYSITELDAAADQFHALLRLADQFYQAGYRAGYADGRAETTTPEEQ